MSKRGKLKGVVFDFDGVIVDSEMHWVDVETPYLSRHIPSWKHSDYAQLIGKSLPEVYELLSSKHAFPLSQKQYFEDYEEMAIELYKEKAKALIDIRGLLEFLRSRSIKIAIASSSKREWIDLALRSNDLAHHFEIIVSAHDKDISRGKPAPDVYIAAAEQLGEDPRDLVAIEDSENGVRSATSAALYCYGLRNGMNDDQDLSRADEIIYGYSEDFLKKLKEAAK